MVANDDNKPDTSEASDELSKAIADLDALLKSDNAAAPEPPPASDSHISAVAAAADPDVALLRAAQKTANAPPAPESDMLLAHLAKNSTLETPAAMPFDMLSIREGSTQAAVVLFLGWHGFYELSSQQQQVFKKRFQQWFSGVGQSNAKRIVMDLDDSLLLVWLDNFELSLDFALQLHKTFFSLLDDNVISARTGIHFGSVEIQSGQQVDGEAIEEAQCLMSLAAANQVLLSAACYEAISAVTPRYNELLQYIGLQKDRFNREHAVYTLTVKTANNRAAAHSLTQQYAPEMDAAPLNIRIPDAEPTPTSHSKNPPASAEHHEADFRLLSDIQNLANTPIVDDTPGIIPLGEPEQSPSDSVFADRIAPEPEEPLPTMSHLPSAEKISKLAEKESQSWAGSAQRELEGQLSSSRPTGMATAATNNEVTKAKPRYRKPVSKLKFALVSLCLLLLVALALPFVMPMDGYANKVAAAASERLKQPVQVGELQFKALPLPHIELNNVSVAGDGLRIGSAQVYLDWTTLMSPTREVKRLVLSGVQVNPAKLTEVAHWFELAGGVSGYPVRQIVLEKASLSGSGVQFNDVTGEINFAQGGIFTGARLFTPDEQYSLNLSPLENSRLSVNGLVHEAALPLLPGWTFSDLSFKGELDRNGLQVSLYEGYIFGGKIYGNARLDWQNGWVMDGNLNADMLTANSFAKVLDANVNGKARFSMRSAQLADLVNSAGFGGNFVMRDGVVNGIDVVDVMRSQGRVTLGGQTRFQQLSGQFMRVRDGYKLQGITLDADVVTAKGSLLAQNKAINGQFSLDILIGSNRSGATLKVDGSNVNTRFQVTH